MKPQYLLILLTFIAACSSEPQQSEEVTRWEDLASGVTITRDSFGVPHISGKTDAHAVFGMLYAQCEDDFNRVEMNYINAMGRLAETEGEGEIWRDLRMKLFIDPEDMKAKYNQSPDWLKELMNAFADGVNYYLHTHPEVQPKVIDRFEPWMALSFSEGSIGGDIERVRLNTLRDFYGDEKDMSAGIIPDNPWIHDDEPRGSNGISIAPELTENGNSLFLINPHTSFFFRSEQHVKSEEGLNAYGAVTWGQFFIYQGFNDRLGWMHTSSRADAIDYYVESIVEKEGKYYYLHDGQEKEVIEKEITVPYVDNSGQMQSRDFTAYYTHHGPVIQGEDDKWITISLMQRPVDAYTQSYMRTKAKNYEEFYKTMEIKTNSSNNTVYADADGNIAYFHGNYIPIRDESFNWEGIVDGSLAATDHKGLHSVDEMVMVKNPATGWIQNCNSTPFTVSGESSPKPENYPNYMAPDSENFRGIHAVNLLQGQSGWTMEKLRDAAYDSHLPGLELTTPALVKALESSDNQVHQEILTELQSWEYRFKAESIPTTLATLWGNEMLSASRNYEREEDSPYEWIANSSPIEVRLQALEAVLEDLDTGFGTWKVSWGEINRYQRLNGEIRQPFNDDEPSLPVGFHSGRWGSLASFGARTYPGTHKMYGTSGNSFVAIVEFGDKLKAWSISTGGQSGNPASEHFDDQALMYTKGEFKEVRYYSEDIEANAEITYQPGKRK